MIRETKFRAWCPYEKKMYPILQMSWHGKKTATLNFNPVIRKAWEDLEIMQFTGLLDESGIEICEGDIVYCTFKRAGREKKVFNAVTVDFEPTWGATISPHDVYSLGRCRDIEIIGNIYENPALLTTPHNEEQ